MALQDKIQQDLKTAMKKADKVGLSALRMILSKAKNRQIEKKASLDDNEVIRIIQGLVRQSRDAIEQFQKGNRQDLVKQEQAFVKICQAYLPDQLSDNDLDVIVSSAIEEIQATSLKELGKVMQIVMEKVAGKADGKIVNQKVRAILSNNT